MKIEKNIAIPPQRGATGKYPFNDMEAGDSFAIESGTKENTVRACATSYSKTAAGTNKKFTVRKTPSGYRCWRTA